MEKWSIGRRRQLLLNESRIGALDFKQGFPAPETVNTLFEFRTFYRGVEAFTQNTFGVSLYPDAQGLCGSRCRQGESGSGVAEPDGLQIGLKRLLARAEQRSSACTAHWRLFINRPGS